MEEKRGTYFIENETRVNRILIRVCLALLLFPPLAAVARWKLQYSALDNTDIIVIGIGLILVIGLAEFLFHRDPKSIVVKYVLLIGLHLGICYAGTKIEINMFMAYALVPAMSCLYFSKWYTIRIGEVCYCMMLISLGLRSAVEAEHDNRISFHVRHSSDPRFEDRGHDPRHAGEDKADEEDAESADYRFRELP